MNMSETSNLKFQSYQMNVWQKSDQNTCQVTQKSNQQHFGGVLQLTSGAIFMLNTLLGLSSKKKAQTSSCTTLKNLKMHQ
jgi:hypothetical protein